MWAIWCIAIYCICKYFVSQIKCYCCGINSTTKRECVTEITDCIFALFEYTYTFPINIVAEYSTMEIFTSVCSLCYLSVISQKFSNKIGICEILLHDNRNKARLKIYKKYCCKWFSNKMNLVLRPSNRQFVYFGIFMLPSSAMFWNTWNYERTYVLIIVMCTV